MKYTEPYNTKGLDLWVNQLGVSRWRIDILTSTTADLVFESAWSRRSEMIVAGVTVPVISREDLIVTKRAAGRKRDLAAVEDLERRRRPC